MIEGAFFRAIWKNGGIKYQCSHNMFLAQAKAMNSCHELLKDGKIGPALNICCVYPASSSPEDYLAAMDYDQLRNRFYLDMAVFGRYPEAIYEYLDQRGYAPVFEEGDRELLESGHPDLIAINYYGGTTVKYISEEENRYKTKDITNVEFMTGCVTEPGIAQVVDNPLQNFNKTYNRAVDGTGLRATLR